VSHTVWFGRVCNHCEFQVQACCEGWYAGMQVQGKGTTSCRCIHMHA
jgi:hypothetical protein